jgi:hypothetical protein
MKYFNTIIRILHIKYVTPTYIVYIFAERIFFKTNREFVAHSLFGKHYKNCISRLFLKNLFF